MNTKKHRHAFAIEPLEMRVLLAADVASNLPDDVAVGTEFPILPVATGSLIDAGTVDAIRGLSNLIGPYTGDSRDVGANELGLGAGWTGPRQFTDQLAYGIPDDWNVTPLNQLADFIDLGAPTSPNETRLLMTRSEPRSFILVGFEPMTEAERWNRYETSLKSSAEAADTTQAIFRDGLGAVLQSSAEIATLTGVRVDYNGILTIQGGVAQNDRSLVQDDMFSFVRSLNYSWDERATDTPYLPHGVIPAGTVPSSSDDLAITAGVLHGDVTLTSASILWDVEGDSNQNATATIKFRRMGSQQWQEALDLNRVVYEGNAKDTGQLRNLNRFAGSIFALSPETTYEIEVAIEDVDGGNFSQITQLTTRAVPRIPQSAAVSEVRNAEELRESSSQVVLLHAGNYGPWTIRRGGTPGAPVIYKALGDGPVRFERINILADHIWLDGIEVIQGGIHGRSAPPDQIQVGVTVTRTTVKNAEHSIDAWGTDWVVTDNVLIGRGREGEGIEFRGRGHLAAFNDISEVSDGISYGDGNIDVHNNRIHDIYDDAIEPDYGWDNYRIWENQTWQSGVHGISFQPIQGGPWYVFRNQITGTGYNPVKMRGGKGAKFIASNTIIYQRHIQNIDRLFEKDGVFTNNFMGVDADNGDNFLGDGIMPNPIEMRLWDYNQYEVLPEKVFKLSDNKSLQELRALGVETHSVVTRKFAIALTAKPDRHSLYTVNSSNVISGNIIDNDLGPVRNTMRIEELDRSPILNTPFAGQYGILTLSEDGAYSYQLDLQHPTISAIAQGETVIESFDYTLIDGVEESTSSLDITIYGGPPTNGNDGDNGRPRAYQDLVTIKSNEPVLGFNVLQNDTDPQNRTLSTQEFVFTQGQFGRIEWEIDGSTRYLLDLANPRIQQLAAGDIILDAFIYIVTNGNSLDVENVVVTIVGADSIDEIKIEDDGYTLLENKVPNTVIGNVLSNDHSTAGPLTISAVEGSAENFNQEIRGEYGLFSLSDTGQLIYQLDNENRTVDSLDEDEVLFEEFTYEASDETRSGSGKIKIEIQGFDDGHYPEVAADSARVSSNVGMLAGNLLLNDFDRDGDQLGVQSVGGDEANVGRILDLTYGILQIDLDGRYFYQFDLEHPDVSSLNGDESVTESITYTAGDIRRSSTTSLTIEITAPSDQVIGDSNGDGIFDSGDLVTIFQAGEYEDEIDGNSDFNEGDWNGDGDFDSSDLIFAFQLGNYDAPAARTAAIDQLFSLNADHFSAVDDRLKRNSRKPITTRVF